MRGLNNLFPVRIMSTGNGPSLLLLKVEVPGKKLDMAVNISVSVLLSFFRSTRDHIGRSTRNFNPVMTSSAGGAKGGAEGTITQGPGMLLRCRFVVSQPDFSTLV